MNPKKKDARRMQQADRAVKKDQRKADRNNKKVVKQIVRKVKKG